MADVNPVVLVAAGTVAAGVIAIVACMRGGSSTSRENKKERKPSMTAKEEAPTATATATKPKKRSKPRNKAKKNAEGKDVPGSSSEAEPAVAVTAATAPAAPTTEEANSDDDNGDDNADDFFLKRDAAKKPKKTKESQEQKASRQERQKQQKNVKKAEEEVVFFTDNNAAPTAGGKYGDYTQGTNNSSYDGWAVVENPRKLKKKSESTSDLEDLPALTPSPLPNAAAAAPPSASAAASTATPAPVEVEEPAPSPPVDLVTKELTVDAKKLGLLIGPKGVTKIGMQTATGTEITMPKVEKDFVGQVTISVTGTAEGVDRAVAALSELCTKGYSTLLASPDFHESYVEVKPKYLPDIIGKGGSSIRAIQAHTGVKISTPSDYVRVLPSGETITPSKVKIILAGTRDKIAVARGLVLDLCKYYYTPVTHPGLTHAEMDIDSRYYNYIIGSKGSEIKHIQANYKVTVHIPNAESANQNLLIVGEAGNVANAEKHIHRLIEKVDERAKAEAEGIALGENAKARIAAAAAAANGANGAEGSAPARRERGPRGPRGGDKDRSSPATDAPAAARGPKDPNAPDAEDEAWTAEYAPRRAPIDLNAMLPATAKFSAAPVSAPASPTPAASTADAAEL